MQFNELMSWWAAVSGTFYVSAASKTQQTVCEYEQEPTRAYCVISSCSRHIGLYCVCVRFSLCVCGGYSRQNLCLGPSPHDQCAWGRRDRYVVRSHTCPHTHTNIQTYSNDLACAHSLPRAHAKYWRTPGTETVRALTALRLKMFTVNSLSVRSDRTLEAQHFLLMFTLLLFGFSP